jgi:hypothetical protein
MRELRSTTNTIEIRDELAGVVHELKYRMPTTKERMQYQAGLLERRGNKILNHAYTQQIKFGAIILEGFKPGTFAVDGKPLSAVKGDAGYRENWKEIIMEGCPELVAVMARTVFEGAGVVAPKSELEFAIADDDGEIVAEKAAPVGE